MKKKIEVLLILMVFLGNVALSGIGIVSYANDENEDKINIEEENMEHIEYQCLKIKIAIWQWK